MKTIYTEDRSQEIQKYQNEQIKKSVATYEGIRFASLD